MPAALAPPAEHPAAIDARASLMAAVESIAPLADTASLLDAIRRFGDQRQLRVLPVTDPLLRPVGALF
ncbi:hypothetical protein ABTB42_20690, partial [Acinetobacter baumannii]